MKMYKLIPYFLAAATSCIFFLLSNEQHLRSNWRDAIARESQIVAIPPGFHTNQTRKNIISRGASKGHVSFSSSMEPVNNHRRFEKRKTTLFTERCGPYSDPASCDILLQQPACSCENDIGAYYCCERAILVVHKMGVTAVQSLTDKHFYKELGRTVHTPEITSHKKIGSMFRLLHENPVLNDYRQVVVTRNWYDAIISGYLYHKSGRECWLDWFGKPNHTGWLLRNSMEDWEHRLLNHEMTNRYNISWNQGNGRDLCRYLIDEPEEIGLRVYTTWAMALYMYPLRDFRRKRHELEDRQGWNRTKYVCYEQLTNPIMHSDVLHDMGRWLFPDKNISFNAKNVRKADQSGHASDQNPKLRSRLREMVKQMDVEVFGRSIEQGNAEFGCRRIINPF